MDTSKDGWIERCYEARDERDEAREEASRLATRVEELEVELDDLKDKLARVKLSRYLRSVLIRRCRR